MVFVPGISTLYDVPQDEEENAKDYEESQQQRALERKLRYEKRDYAVMALFALLAVGMIVMRRLGL